MPPIRSASLHRRIQRGHTITVRSFAPEEWRLYRDLRLRALRESPDAFGSTLAREAPRPDAEWAQRLARGAASPSELPLVVEVDGAPSGLAWVRRDEAVPTIARVYQVWVAPEQRGHGCGRALLEAAIAWARSVGVAALHLDVTCGDTPAARLYERLGFRSAGAPQPLRPDSPLLVQPMRLTLQDEPRRNSP